MQNQQKSVAFISATPCDLPDSLMRLPEVLRAIGIKKSALYSWVAAGTFPAPVKLGARAVAWRRSQVMEFINSRVEAA